MKTNERTVQSDQNYVFEVTLYTDIDTLQEPGETYTVIAGNDQQARQMAIALELEKRPGLADKRTGYPVHIIFCSTFPIARIDGGVSAGTASLARYVLADLWVRLDNRLHEHTEQTYKKKELPDVDVGIASGLEAARKLVEEVAHDYGIAIPRDED